MKTAKIVDEQGNVIHKGLSIDMELAFEYLTKPFYILAETRGLRMADAYTLNGQYWNEAARKAKKFHLISTQG